MRVTIIDPNPRVEPWTFECGSAVLVGQNLHVSYADGSRFTVEDVDSDHIRIEA